MLELPIRIAGGGLGEVMVAGSSQGLVFLMNGASIRVFFYIFKVSESEFSEFENFQNFRRQRGLGVEWCGGTASGGAGSERKLGGGKLLRAHG